MRSAEEKLEFKRKLEQRTADFAVRMYPQNAEVTSLAVECEEMLKLFQTIRRHVAV